MTVFRRRQPAPAMRVPMPFNPMSGAFAPVGPQKHDMTRVGLFRVLADHGDYLICEGLDPEFARAYNVYSPVSVAKPYLLMRSPWDGVTVTIGGVNVTYAYLDNSTRSVAREGESESAIQSVSPPYFEGDVLSVARCRCLAGDASGLYDLYGKPVEFVDVNAGGRIWDPASASAGLKVYFAVIRHEADPSASIVQCDVYGEQFGSPASGTSAASGLYASPTSTNTPCIKGAGTFVRGELVAVSIVDGEHRMEKFGQSALRSRIDTGQVAVGYKDELPIFEATDRMAAWDILGSGGKETLHCVQFGYLRYVYFDKAFSGNACFWAILNRSDAALVSAPTVGAPTFAKWTTFTAAWSGYREWTGAGSQGSGTYRYEYSGSGSVTMTEGTAYVTGMRVDTYFNGVYVSTQPLQANAPPLAMVNSQSQSFASSYHDSRCLTKAYRYYISLWGNTHYYEYSGHKPSTVHQTQHYYAETMDSVETASA